MNNDYLTKKTLEKTFHLALEEMKFSGTSEDLAYNEGLTVGINIGFSSFIKMVEAIAEDKTLTDILGEDFLGNLKD